MHKFNKSNKKEVESLTEFQNDKEVETRRKTTVNLAGKWPLEGLAESSIKRKKKMSKTKLEEENILKNNKNESLTVHCRRPPSKPPENAGKASIAVGHGGTVERERARA